MSIWNRLHFLTSCLIIRSPFYRCDLATFRMRLLVLLLVAIGTASGNPHFFGYFYPNPTPDYLPEVYTETIVDVATETLVSYVTAYETVYLTDVRTTTVANPVYLTSTEYSVSTVVVPSPVVQYVTETVFSTVVGQADTAAQTNLQSSLSYLPPRPSYGAIR
ncbi:uncharacterized protein LOC125957904 [Anopheles darlingi]|uniref:uncharacterized protein LOC125957904 n=1 Tax=Anopheles darlingi TaxID=43151 RepID=UPI0021002464|nr:uncharacterized protein LOC125957904 [Anopheles darlingi]